MCYIKRIKPHYLSTRMISISPLALSMIHGIQCDVLLNITLYGL